MSDLGLYVLVGLILLLIEITYFNIAFRFRIVDTPHFQSSHKGVVLRGGGVIFFFAYLIWSIIHGFHWYGGLFGLSIITFISFIDDIYSISPKIRLACQFLAILMMCYHSGLVRTAPHVIALLSIVCVGTVNIFNFMDGINGMTGGYSLVVAIVLLYIDLYVIKFASPDLISFVIISLLIFNFFNFRRHAKCFAGDVGSLAIGFILMYLVLRLCLRGHSMGWVAMLIVYGVDGVLTMLHRVLLRENLMKPHKKHAYQIMANELNMPHLMVSSIYMALQAICSVWFIVKPGYPTLFFQLGLLTAMYVMFMKKYYHLHVKNK